MIVMAIIFYALSRFLMCLIGTLIACWALAVEFSIRYAILAWVIFLFLKWVNDIK